MDAFSRDWCRLVEANTTKNQNGCWNWNGAKDKNGYGAVRFLHARDKAHRIAWKLFRGPIPEEMCICHACDNPSCVNPVHLFVGSKSDNMQDKVVKQRQAVAHGPLSTQDATEMRTMYWGGVASQGLIAEMFGVSQAAVSAIVLGRTHQAVPSFSD